MTRSILVLLVALAFAAFVTIAGCGQPAEEESGTSSETKEQAMPDRSVTPPGDDETDTDMDDDDLDDDLDDDTGDDDLDDDDVSGMRGDDAVIGAGDVGTEDDDLIE